MCPKAQTRSTPRVPQKFGGPKRPTKHSTKHIPQKYDGPKRIAKKDSTMYKSSPWGGLKRGKVTQSCRTKQTEKVTYGEGREGEDQNKKHTKSNTVNVETDDTSPLPIADSTVKVADKIPLPIVDSTVNVETDGDAATRPSPSCSASASSTSAPAPFSTSAPMASCTSAPAPWSTSTPRAYSTSPRRAARACDEQGCGRISCAVCYPP